MTLRYRIGEFAELSGVSAKTLRFYDEIGLLRPASVDSRTRYRLYLPRQLQELASIVALKEAGMSLAEIRNLTVKALSGKDRSGKDRSTKNRREILIGLKQTVEQSMQTASHSLNWINAALQELDETENPIPVVVKRRPGVAVATIRAKVQSYGEIERFEHELLSELPAQSIGELRGVLWHSCADADCLEGETFIALKERVPSRSVYELKLLPAATLACAYAESDEMSAERAYRAIKRWMGVRGYDLAGPKRELYVGPLLEIQFPLKSS